MIVKTENSFANFTHFFTKPGMVLKEKRLNRRYDFHYNFWTLCLVNWFLALVGGCLKSNGVKRPLLAWVPSLARFFDNLTEITCMKKPVVEFFFTEAVNTVVWCGAVGLIYTVTILLKKKIVCDMTTRNWQFFINKHKETALPKSLFCG